MADAKSDPLNRSGMIAVLCMVQNSIDNSNRDIMTFAGFLDDEELAGHVMSEFRNLSGYERRGEIVAYARSLSASEKEPA